jgi:hypothetical protein
MDHHSHTKEDIPGLPADAVRLEGPPAPSYGGWAYTYHSDMFPGVWSVIFHDNNEDPAVIYQPPIGDI